MKLLLCFIFVTLLVPFQSWNLFSSNTFKKNLVKTASAAIIATFTFNNNFVIEPALSDARLNAPTAGGSH